MPERGRGIRPLATIVLLAATLLAEILAWLALRAGIGMKVGAGALFWSLVAIVALGGIVLFMVARNLVRRRFRFSIRELLVGTLFVGVGLGWLLNLSEPTRAQRNVGARFVGLGATVDYGGVDEPAFENLVGRQYFHGVTAVYGPDVIGDDDLAALETLSDLETLTLGGPQITDAGLRRLEGLTSLRRLALLRTNVAGAGFPDLAALPNLESLDLYSSAISDAGLARLPRWPSLRTLNLNRTPISDVGLARVGALTGLESLYLDRTGITDAGLEHLTDLKNLGELHLAGTQITDAGLERLRTLGKLRRLRLEGCRLVTDEGVDALRRARPELVVSR